MKQNVPAAGVMVMMLLTAVSLSAYDLRSNMLLLNTELSEVQQAIMTSNMEGLSNALKRFAHDAEALLGNKDEFAAMLPKAKEHKAKIAVDAAHVIAYNVQVIEDAISNKNQLSEKKRKEEAQRAYSFITRACFNCHNVVRDPD